mmetsp:Transcript_7532/g.16288  ORF Transcript_7532/g.16288 Transcript_7532/m.16288 type:complete len:81 (-) Transcript_7532:303-545(-)
MLTMMTKMMTTYLQIVPPSKKMSGDGGPFYSRKEIEDIPAINRQHPCMLNSKSWLNLWTKTSAPSLKAKAKQESHTASSQ